MVVFVLGLSITFLRIGLIGFDGLSAEGWRMNFLFYGLFLVVLAVVFMNYKPMDVKNKFEG